MCLSYDSLLLLLGSYVSIIRIDTILHFCLKQCWNLLCPQMYLIMAILTHSVVALMYAKAHLSLVHIRIQCARAEMHGMRG